MLRIFQSKSKVVLIYILALSFIFLQSSVMAGSVSRVQVFLDIQNKGSVKGEIVRHLAPLTAAEILKSLPLQQIVHKFENKFVYVETGLNIGREKQRTQFKRGQIAYMTFHGSICIFINDTISAPMNPLGTIVSSLELLESVSIGDVITVRSGL